MQHLDLDSWPRKKHFHNFLNFSQPFFNITATVEVTKIKEVSKNLNLSFFLSYYFVALKAINGLDPFKYRIRESKVIVHDVIHGGCTVLNADETFSFAYFDYFDDFQRYYQGAQKELDQLKKEPALDPQFHRDDLIHSTAIPWMSFTSFEHAKRFETNDSTPKFAFGKYKEEQGKLFMPISVSVHHALMDGIHVGKFFKNFESLSSKADQILVP